MASIQKTYNSMGLPMNINRSNPIPVDNTELWYSLEDAQNYALNDPRAYVGQNIKVINEDSKSINSYIIGIDGKLINANGIFVGTYAEYEAANAGGYVPLNTIVIITDDMTNDEEEDNPENPGGDNPDNPDTPDNPDAESDATSSKLGTGQLGYMILA